MKALLRLSFLALVVTGLATVPTSADFQTSSTSQLNCSRFCMVALCPSPGTCGPYIDANGKPACGCHS